MRARHLSLCLIIASTLAACSSTPEPKPQAQLIEETREANRAARAEAAQEEFRLGNAALVAREFGGAIAAYERASNLDASPWEYHHNSAIALSAKPDFEAAIAQLRLAMDKGGDKDWRVWFTLGNVYQNRNMYEEAVGAYRAGLSLHSEPHFESLLNIASAYMLMGRLDESRATLDYMLQLAPRDPRVHHNLAMIYQLQLDTPKALEGYTTVHELDPSFDQSYFNAGELLRHDKRCDEAIPKFQKYVELSPDGPYVSQATQRIQLCEDELRGVKPRKPAKR